MNSGPLRFRSTLPRAQAQRGYLLLEVLLAMAILTMITAIVFRIIQTTVRATQEVTYLQSLQEKVDGIDELLRENFASLPPDVQFQTRTLQGNSELVFQNAAFHFTPTPGTPVYGTLVLAGRPDASGRLALSFLQEPENAREHLVELNQEGRAAWIPLLVDLDRISWRFYDVHSRNWRADWQNTSSRPTLVELTVRLTGQKQDHRLVFAWPTTVSAS
jgi:type II secretory pathway component PulJ